MPLVAKLICQYNDRITAEKAQLDNAVLNMQSLYDGFKALNMVISLAEAVSLFNQYISPEYRSRKPSGIPSMLAMAANIQPEQKPETVDFLETFVKDKLVAVAQLQTFNGVPLLPEKAREMIALPDLSDLVETLQSFGNTTGQFNINSRLLSVTSFKHTGDVISRADNAYATIEAKHTHYTKNDRGVNIANSLQALCAALNNYKNLIGSGELSRFDRENSMGETLLRGVQIAGTDYVPSLSYIRYYEGF